MNYTRLVIKPSENEDYRYQLFSRKRYTTSFGVQKTPDFYNFKNVMKSLGKKVGCSYYDDIAWVYLIYIYSKEMLDKIGLEDAEGNFVPFRVYIEACRTAYDAYGRYVASDEMVLAGGDLLHGLEFHLYEKYYSNPADEEEPSYIQMVISTSSIKDESCILTKAEKEKLEKRVNFPRIAIEDPDKGWEKFRLYKKKEPTYGFLFAENNDVKFNRFVEILQNNYPDIVYEDSYFNLKLQIKDEASLNRIGFEDSCGQIVTLKEYIGQNWTEEVEQEDKRVADGGVSTLNKEETPRPSELMQDGMEKALSQMIEKMWRRENEIIIANIDLFQGLEFDISKVYETEEVYYQLKITKQYVEDEEAFDNLAGRG